MTNLQRGIAIGPILFVVALLAVLATAIAAGTGAFSGDISTVRAKAIAAALLEYAEQVKFAVDRLLAKGCKETEISFENPFVTYDGGYTNPNAPSDKSCHVFDVNGGGVVWQDPPPEVVYNDWDGRWEARTGTDGNWPLEGLGTKQHDLFFWVRGVLYNPTEPANAKGRVLLAACHEINKMLGIEGGSGMGGLPRYWVNGPFWIRFKGYFGTPGQDTWAEDMIRGKTTFCAAGPDDFQFIKVLIVR